MPPWKKPTPFLSPVLCVDALGIAQRVSAADAKTLEQLNDVLEKQYFHFQSKIPFAFVAVFFGRVWGTREFSTFRLNDMFILFSRKQRADSATRHLIAASLLYQVLVVEGFIPRGGLGYGLVLAARRSILGGGFIDAYDAAEKRSDALKDICAIQLSRRFIGEMYGGSRNVFRLVCFYRDAFFINPRVLVDPEMGRFDNKRILDLLIEAGANQDKLSATEAFLSELEDYEAAAKPGSRTSAFLRSNIKIWPVT